MAILGEGGFSEQRIGAYTQRYKDILSPLTGRVGVHKFRKQLILPLPPLVLYLIFLGNDHSASPLSTNSIHLSLYTTILGIEVPLSMARTRGQAETALVEITQI